MTLASDYEKSQVNEAVLIASPGGFVGYQFAGALSRLGRRISGVVKEASESAKFSQLPMPTIEYDWQASPPLKPWPGKTNEFGSVLLAADDELPLGLAPSPQRLASFSEILAELARSQEKLHPIVVLPQSVHEDWIKSFFSFYKNGTLFLCPPLFGFRDGALMSRALELHASNPALLTKAEAEVPCPLSFVGDLVGFLVSAPQNVLCFGRVISLPPALDSLESWRRAFVSAFKPEPGFSSRLKGLISTERLSTGLNLQNHSQLLRERNKSLAATSALEVFPSTLHGATRIFEQSAKFHERAPKLELHFPPSRGP